MKTDAKYDTIYGRFFALFFDLALYGLLFGLLEFVLRTKNYAKAEFIIAVIEAFGIYIYKIVMHAAFGKTLGKMLFGVVVLNRDESRLSIGHSIIRDAIPLSIIGTISVIAGPIFSYQPGYESQLDKFINNGSIIEIVIGAVLSIFYVVWEIAVFISMQINPKRLSIQDGLSKSIVIRDHRIKISRIAFILAIMIIRILLHRIIGIV